MKKQLNWKSKESMFIERECVKIKKKKGKEGKEEVEVNINLYRFIVSNLPLYTGST